MGGQISIKLTKWGGRRQSSLQILYGYNSRVRIAHILAPSKCFHGYKRLYKQHYISILTTSRLPFQQHPRIDYTFHVYTSNTQRPYGSLFHPESKVFTYSRGRKLILLAMLCKIRSIPRIIFISKQSI